MRDGAIGVPQKQGGQGGIAREQLSEDLSAKVSYTSLRVYEAYEAYEGY